MSSDGDSLRGGEQVAAVGGDAVDGTLVSLQLPERPQGVRVPQLENPGSAAAQQRRRPGHHAQRTHPVPVGVGDLLWTEETFCYDSDGVSPQVTELNVGNIKVLKQATVLQQHL